MTGHQKHYGFSCEIDGKTYDGNYWVAGKILVVSTAKGGTSTRLSGREPEALARELLLKLAIENRA